MTIHEHQAKTKSSMDELLSSAPESLRPTLDRVDRTVRKFLDNLSQIDVEAMSPFPPCGLAKAVLLRRRLWRETGDDSHQKAMDNINLMIKQVTKRWIRASK